MGSGGTILQVCDFGSPTPGNFIPSQHAVARRARSDLGLGTHFVLPRLAGGNSFAADLEADGFAVTLLDRSERLTGRAHALHAIAAEQQAVLVHSHFTGLDQESLWAAKRVGARTIWHLHSGSYHSPTRRLLTDLVKVQMLGRACDRIVACAEWVGEQAVQRGYPESKVRVVENAIDLARFSEDALPPRSQAREAFGLPEDATILLGFGWDPHRKGVDLILQAGAQLARERTVPPTVVIVGTEALRAYVHDRLGAQLPPWLMLRDPVEDVPGLLSAADLFLNASRAEGLPYAIGEAMAARLPVVASDIPGSRFYLPAPGLESFADGDGRDLARAIVDVLDRTDLQQASEGNREFALARLPLSRYADEMLGVFSELVAPRPRVDSA